MRGGTAELKKRHTGTRGRGIQPAEGRGKLHHSPPELWAEMKANGLGKR